MKHLFSQLPILITLFLSFLPLANTFSQVICSDETPYYYVDLTGNPDSLYLSPPDVRDGDCCGSMFPDRCIEFTIILDNASIGLAFDIFSGAEPPGALFYQIDCGPPVMVGEDICLQGGEEYSLTFCKPGANQNVYSIQSIPAPISTDTITTRIGCEAELTVEGPIDTTVVWNDVTSNDGRYNDYLSCLMGCDTTTITPDADAPSIIRYEVCGTYIPETCSILPITICDTVVVNVIEDVQVGTVPSPWYYCENALQPLTATINLPEEDIVFNWYDETGFANGGPPIANDISFVPQSSQTYYIIATDTTFGLCNMDTANVDIIIQPLPEFSFPESTILCTGDSEMFSLNDDVTYTWDPDETVTQVPGTSTFEVTPMVTTTYNVVAEDSVGCTFANQLLVEVIPEFGVSISFSDILFCEDEISAINAQLTGVTGDVVFQWYNDANDQLVFTGQSYTPSESGTFYVVATNNDFQACNVDTAFVEVTIQPVPEFDAPSPTFICEGESEVIDLPEGFSYTWSPNADVAQLTPNSFEISPPSTIIYNITAEDNFGCTFTDIILAEVIPFFGVNLSFNEVLFCEDAIDPIEAQLAGIGGDVTYSWYNSNDQFLFSGQSFLPNTSGTYYVVATNNDFDACNVDTAFVDVMIQPVPQFTLPPSTTICEGESEVFELVEDFSYTWSPNIFITDMGAGVFEITPTETTTYTVTSEDNIGCTYTDEIVVEVIPEFGITTGPSQFFFCEDNVTAIEAQLTGIGGDITYQWYNEMTNQLLFTGQAFLPPSSGDYYVIATNNDFSACNLDTAYIDVTIQPSPIFPLPPSLTLCEGDTEVITLQDGYTYSWSPSATVNPILGTNDFEIFPSATTTYSVTSQDNFGCTYTDEIIVEVVPEFGVTVSPSQYLFCEDNVQAVQAQLTGIGGNVTYSWYHSGTNQFLFTGQDFLPPSSGSYYVVVINEDFNSCNRDTAFIDVTIQPLPEFNLVSSLTLCEGEVEIIELPDGFSYTWSPSSTVTPILGTNSFEIAPNQTTTYTVTAMEFAGCSYSDQVDVEVIPEFGVNISPSQVLFCEGNVQPVQAQLIGNGTNITYRWYNANSNQFLFTGQSFLPPSSGSFYVVATNNDFQSCNIDTAFVEITIQPSPAFNLPNSTTICEGESEVFDLQDGFTYSWSPSATVDPIVGTNSFEVSPTQTTNYTVTAMDNVGCTFSDDLTVEVIPAFGIVINEPQVLFCEQNVQPIDAQLIGAGGNVVVRWYNTATNQLVFTGETFLPNSSGTYAAVATNFDLPSCNVDTAEVTVTIQPLPEFDLVATIGLCGGETEIVELPLGPSYSWSPSGGVSLIAGTNVFEIAPTNNTTYTVTAVDMAGCTFSDEIDVEVVPAFGVIVDQPQVVYCENNVSPVQAQLTGIGGDVTYRWYNAVSNQLVFTGQSFLPSNSGNYYVIATNNDYQSCNIDTATLEVLIQPLPEFNIPGEATLCGGEIATFELPIGATYSWSPSSGVTQIPGTTTFEVSPSSNTSYTVTAQDNIGCTYTDEIDVSVIPDFGVSVGASEVLYCSDNVQPIDAQIIGAGGNVTFRWYNAISNQLVFTGQSYLPASSGNYYVIATNNDLVACNIDTATVEVIIQPLPEFNIQELETLCSGETATFELPIGPTYSWSPTSGVNLVSGNNVFEVSPTSTTTYTVTAEDGVGCTFDDEIDIEVIPEFEVGISQPDFLFCDDNIEPIQALVNGAGGNVTFQWYNGNSNQLVFTGQSFLPSISGSYYVVGTNTDFQSCNIDSAFVEVIIEESPDFSIQPSVELCGGETITFELPEGPNYTWLPSTGVTLVQGTNVFEVSPTQSTDYTIAAQNVVGCSSTQSLSVEIGPEFGVAIIPSDVLYCSDEIEPLQAQLTGTDGDITYRWYNDDTGQLVFVGESFLPNTSGTYSVVGTNNDYLACNMDTATVSVTIQPAPEFEVPEQLALCPGETTILELPEGPNYFWLPSASVTLISGNNIFALAPSQNTTYSITAQDAVGCTYTAELPVEVPPAFSVQVTPEQVVFCENDIQPLEAELIGTGGNITYLWYDSISLVNGNQPLFTGQEFTPSFPGTYAVVAINEDFTACNSDTAMVSVAFQPEPQFNLPQLNSICAGNSVTVNLPDAYTYTWVPDVGVTPGQIPGQFLISPNSSQVYTVVAEDENGCSSSGQLNIAVTASPLAEAGPPLDINCAQEFVQLNGSIENDGPNVSFDWVGPAGGILQGEEGLSPTVILPGWYFLIASNDQNGCSTIDSVLISTNFEEPIAVLPDELNLDCGTASILVDGSGSTSGMNIEYDWANLNGGSVNEDGTPFLIVDSPGTYSLTVINMENGCEATDSVEITSPPLLEGIVVTGNEICHGDDNGVIRIDTVIGGTPPFLYSFNGSPFVDVTAFPELSAGNYTLGVLDANGCEWWEDVLIQELDPIELELGIDQEIANGEIIQLNIETNLQNFLIDSINWSPAEFLSCNNCPSPIAAPQITTTFDVELWDIFGCSATDEITINLVEREIAYIPNGFSPNGDNTNERFTIYTRPGVAEVAFLKIFDRWGNMVFEAYDFPPNEPQFGWDGNFEGRPMNAAVFVYYTKIKLVNGESVTRKGDVTLVR